MSSVIISSVVLATEPKTGQVSAGVVERVVACHGKYEVTSPAAAGPTLAAGATGFVVKGLSGSTYVRKGQDALATPAGASDQYAILTGDNEYIPAKAGEVLSLIEVV